jgi:transcriptional regulator with XRE-family HTH domain
MCTSQSAIARLESEEIPPSTKTLLRFAEAKLLSLDAVGATLRSIASAP